MQQGILVGKLARDKFPEGHYIGGEPSNGALQAGKPLFEVRFSNDGMTVRTDILRPSASGGWRLIEVKSSKLNRSSSRKEALRDVAFQVFVLSDAEFQVNEAEIMHLNPDYVRGTERNLFEREVLGSDLREYLDEADEKAPWLAEILRKPNPPNLWPSRNCNTCDCPDRCKELPEQSIFTLPRLYGCLDELLEKGKVTLDEIEGEECLRPEHRNYIQAVQIGESYVNEERIRSALSEVEYPLHFLDFETVNYGFPAFEGTRPWQKVPFQYSLHIKPKGKKPRHKEYLHSDDGDPRPPLVDRLLSDVEPQGSIVVYNQWFEENVLKGLTEAFPRHAEEIDEMIDRLWDQAKIFRNWHFIDPVQKGKWSLKNVLPAFAPDMAHGNLGFQDGMEAVVKYNKMISPATSGSEAESIRQELLKYCRRDTYAMVVIHEKLKELVGLK